MPLWWRKLRARAGGFFWLPCPVCGEMFGGHEVRVQGHTIDVGDGHGRSTCPNCPHYYVVYNGYIAIGRVSVHRGKLISELVVLTHTRAPHVEPTL